MQNRYAGDVGDFGKFGLLRKIEDTGLKVGVNWYLVPDEGHNQDGKHTGYQKNDAFLDCDNELLRALNTILEENNRSVEAMENLRLLKTDIYYREVLKQVTKENLAFRSKWLDDSINCFSGCDLVFLDPDNGMKPKSVGPYSKKAIKYVLPEEIITYYREGHSVMFYSHRTREKLDVYLRRFDKLFNDEVVEDSTIKGVSFKRGTTRDYFFILQKDHVEKVERCLDEFLKGNWSRHFDRIEMEAAHATRLD